MARLSIPDQPTFADFTVTTPTSVFPISFSLFAKADLTVLVDGVDIGQSGFTFSGDLLDGGGYVGGTVTLNAAVDDCTVRIERNVAPTRSSGFAPAASVPVGSVDQALNRLTATQQDIKRSKVERPYARAGKFLAFDFDGLEVASEGTGADAGLRADLVRDVGTSMLGFLQIGAGAVGESLQTTLRRVGIYPQQYGAVGDGVTNDRAAIALADTVAQALGRPLVFTAPHRVGSNLTILSPITFEKGGEIVPSNGVEVRLTGPFTASLERIFDLANGGIIVLPDLMGEVWAAWWGANTSRTDNEVPIQQAVTALEAFNSDESSPLAYAGGAVRIHRGEFLVSGPITLRNIVRLVGEARDYSRLTANAATWSGDRMLHCVNFEARANISAITQANPAVVTTTAPHGFNNGDQVTPENVGGMTQLSGTFYEVAGATSTTFQLSGVNSTGYSAYTSGGTFTRYRSQFGVRCENLTLNAGGLAAIGEVVLSESWNEQCGLKHCLINNFRLLGLKLRKGYGGSAISNIEDVEIMGNNIALSAGIDAEVSEGFTSTYHDVKLTRVTITGCVVGVNAANKIRVIADAVHIEDADLAFFLSGAARLCGSGIKASRDCDALVGLDTNWSGRIDSLPYVQGPAPRVLIDYRSGKSGYTPFDGEFLPGPLDYPFRGRPIFGGYLVAGTTPPTPDADTLLQSVSRTGTGQYDCTFVAGFNLANAANYSGRAWPNSATNAGVTCQVVPQTSGVFRILCTDASGAAVNVDFIGFEIFHKP